MSFKRDNGGFIGNFVTPTSGRATGFFSVPEVAAFQKQNLWPSLPVSTRIEYLIIGGGGGAAGDGAGGGGAGGYRCSAAGESSGGGASAETPVVVFQNTTYAVTVGAGGLGTSVGGGVTEGNDSVFATLSAFGGGIGQRCAIGGNGGSGGGGATRQCAPGPFTTKAGGDGITGQGYGGGTATNYDNLMAIGAGGGGAGAAGGNSSGANGGNGGTGISSSITGSAVTRGGGGGGGAQFYPTSQGGCGCGSPGSGGSGGGGNPAPMTAGAAGDNGTANTGGGGGAGSGRAFQSPGSTGGSGGSGIVVLRMLDNYRATFSAGLTVSETLYGGYRVYTITQGTGTVTFVPNS